MIDELHAALTIFHAKWHTLVANRTDKAFFEALRPTAVAWKTADRAEYDKLYVELHDQADQIIETWMNGRWVAKFHLREQSLQGGVEIIKLMQRRPDSTDPVGLDHVDFFSRRSRPEMQTILEKEPDLKWSVESNTIIEGYEWLSLWFDGTEAKLKSDTVLDIIQAELHQLNERLTSA